MILLSTSAPDALWDTFGARFYHNVAWWGFHSRIHCGKCGVAVGASSLYTIVGMDGVCVMATPAPLHCMMRGCGHNAQIRRMAGDLEFIWNSHEFAAGDLECTCKYHGLEVGDLELSLIRAGRSRFYQIMSCNLVFRGHCPKFRARVLVK